MNILAIILLVIGAFFSFSYFNVKQSIVTKTKEAATSTVENENSYIDERLNSYFDIND